MNKLRIGAFAVGMLPTNFYYLWLEPEAAKEQYSSEKPAHSGEAVPVEGHCPPETMQAAAPGNKSEDREAVVFDPGDHGDRLYEALREQHIRVKAVFLTHAHFDHIWGVSDLVRLSGAPLYAWEGERRLCSDRELNGSAGYGRPCTVKPDRFLRDGEQISAAGLTFTLLATPGHTEGSCCYYFDADAMPGVTADGTEGSPRHALLSGDTVFAGSVGRTDLATGSASALGRSIHDKILPLPGDTIFYPGHGCLTDMATEKQINPFFR